LRQEEKSAYELDEVVTCMVARQQRKNRTTLGFRKIWQQRGCTGPQPQRSSLFVTSLSTEDDSDLLDCVADQSSGVWATHVVLSGCLTALWVVGGPGRGSRRQRSGRSVIAVLLDCMIALPRVWSLVTITSVCWEPGVRAPSG